jgi:hypothetical protein
MIPRYEKFQTVDASGKALYFTIYPLFEFRNGTYLLKYFMIFANETIVVSNESFKLAELQDGIQLGVVVSAPPEGTRVYIPELCIFTVTQIVPIVPKNQVIAEILDLVSWLSGKSTSLDLCREAYLNHLGVRSKESIQLLASAYERVPEHLRVWLLGFDQKDFPIRKELGLV